MKNIAVIFLSGLLLVAMSWRVAAQEPAGWPPADSLAPAGAMDNAVSKPEQPVKEKRQRAKRMRNGKISFETFDESYVRAVEYYNKHQYLSAARMFEELYPLSMGTPHADTILYMFSDCYYQNKDYEMAAFHFKDYARRYPGSARAELATFMSIKAVYNLSPYYALDQSETIYAIDEINVFISMYPNSPYMTECNEMLDILRNKLAKKEFEVLKLYFDTENYRATQIAVENFLKSYAYSKYAPEAAFILVKNNYDYARKSVASKMRERYEACVSANEALAINFPYSEFVEEGKKISDEAKKQIEKIIHKQNKN